MRPPAKRQMKISSYVIDLPVDGTPMYSPWCVPVTVLRATNRFDRQWGPDQRVRLDDLADRVRDEFGVAAAQGVLEAFERRFIGCFLGC
jgi:hypothetical protein